MTRRVAEELLEIAPHRLRVGGLRRAEIDDQHANIPTRDRRVIGGSVRYGDVDIGSLVRRTQGQARRRARRRDRRARTLVRRRRVDVGAGAGGRGRIDLVVHLGSEFSVARSG